MEEPDSPDPPAWAEEAIKAARNHLETCHQVYISAIRAALLYLVNTPNLDEPCPRHRVLALRQQLRDAATLMEHSLSAAPALITRAQEGLQAVRDTGWMATDNETHWTAILASLPEREQELADLQEHADLLPERADDATTRQLMGYLVPEQFMPLALYQPGMVLRDDYEDVHRRYTAAHQELALQTRQYQQALRMLGENHRAHQQAQQDLIATQATTISTQHQLIATLQQHPTTQHTLIVAQSQTIENLTSLLTALQQIHSPPPPTHP